MEKEKYPQTPKLIQDDFFEDGKAAYKFGQTLIATVGWVILLYPLLIMVNSIAPKPFLPYIYHWDNAQGRIFLAYISIVAVVGIVLIGGLSLLLLRRNNKLETQALAKKKYYDQAKNEARLTLMNEIYTERFGEEDYRRNVNYHVVRADENFSRTYIKDAYKEKGLLK